MTVLYVIQVLGPLNIRVSLSFLVAILFREVIPCAFAPAEVVLSIVQ